MTSGGGMTREEISTKVIEINKRRFALIHKEMEMDLTEEEAEELDRLQLEVDKYVDLLLGEHGGLPSLPEVLE